MIESIKKLHTSFGSVLNNFLKDIVCEDESCTQCNCDLQSYESHQVFWRNIELTDDLNVPKLTSFRKALLDQLEKEILKYFPDIDLKNFDIFLPENFRRNRLQVDLFAELQWVLSEISGYGKQEIANLAEFFGFEKVQLLQEWAKFLQLVYSNKAIWSSIYNQPPAIFWSTILCEFKEIPILTQKLIETVLVLPIGKLI